LIINEGSFTANNGSINFVNDLGVVEENVFMQVNGISLGDVVQSYTKADTVGVIVVNNSQKVELVQAETFASLGTLTEGFDYPRFALPVGEDDIYISNGNFNGTVQIVDKASLAVTNTLDVGFGPEQMIAIGGQVFVANSGGFGADSTISVLDVATETVVETIEVGKTPVDIIGGDNNTFWVLCKGVSDFSNFPTILKTEPALLVQIDGTTNSIVQERILIEAGDTGDVSRLSVSPDGTSAYFLLLGSVYTLDLRDSNASPELFVQGSFYGLSVDPRNGEVWVAETDFTQSSDVDVYDESGSFLRSLSGGIAPNGVFFN